MSDTDGLRYIKIPLNNGSDEIPGLGFGTLIPDPIATKEATTTALEMGFRQFDCAERYRNEEQLPPWESPSESILTSFSEQ